MMLKRISHIVLSLVLLVATTGVAISKHYCSGNLVSVSIFAEADACCDDGNCCQTEASFIQVKEDFSTVSVAGIPQLSELQLFGVVLPFFIETQPATQETESFLFADLPPPPKIQTVLSQRQTYLL